MDASRLRRGNAALYLQIGLAVFVLLWLLDAPVLGSLVPIWLPFLVALGLEMYVLLVPRRARSAADRKPLEIDRERYGYEAETDELLLVRDEGDERWIPYTGQTAEEIDELIADPEQETLPARPYVPQERRRPLGRFLIAVGIIGALGALVWFVDSRRGWNGLDVETKAKATARFSAEASRIARHEVSIRCDESGRRVGAVQHSDGVAEVGGRLAFLTPERCYDLYRAAFENDVSFSRTARSIAVLAHEAWHLQGVSDESTTECYALQSGVELGQRFGIAEDTARRMMRQQFVENSGRAGAGFEYRVSSECRDGGALDLDPQSSEFP